MKKINSLQALLEYAHALPWPINESNEAGLISLGVALKCINEEAEGNFDADVASANGDEADVGQK